MNTEHETRPPGGPPPPGFRPMGGLTRSNDDVVISGLCAGLGRQFGIDPLIFRIAFVVMALAGGTGILLYLVGWALVPDDAGNTFGARWLPGSERGHKLLAAGLAGIGVLLLMDEIFDGHGDDMPLGLVLVGLGAAVLWSRRGGRTLTPPPAGGWTPTGGPVPTSPPPPPMSPPPPVPSWPPPPVAGEGEPRSPDAPASASASVEVDAEAEVDRATADVAPSESILTTPPPAGSSAWAETTAPVFQSSPPLAPPVYAPPVRTAAGRPPKPPTPPKPRSALVAVTLSLLAILAGVVALAGLDLVTGLALALFLVAGAMIVGAWRGRARGLIPIALLLSSVLFVASLIDVPFEGGAGERLFVPVSVEEVRSPYRLVAGELRLDLRRVDLTGRTLPVVASMATGNIIVTVPDDVAVEVHGQVGAGDLVVFGRDWGGVGIDERVVSAGPEGAGRLRLDLHVGLGQVEVRRAAA